MAHRSVTHNILAFRRISSVAEGVRNERLFVSILAPKPLKRKGNNITGQRGTEKCIFCVKSKKKVYGNFNVANLSVYSTRRPRMIAVDGVRICNCVARIKDVQEGKESYDG